MCRQYPEHFVLKTTAALRTYNTTQRTTCDDAQIYSHIYQCRRIKKDAPIFSQKRAKAQHSSGYRYLTPKTKITPNSEKLPKGIVFLGNCKGKSNFISHGIKP